MTGASSGFGRAIVDAALARGDLVAGGVRSPLADDGDSVDLGSATHVARDANAYTDPSTGQTYTGQVDVLNPTYDLGRRVLALVQPITNP